MKTDTIYEHTYFTVYTVHVYKHDTFTAQNNRCLYIICPQLNSLNDYE